MNRYMLDAGPLGRVCHPRRFEEAKRWVDRELAGGSEVYVPEVVDYELRRELLRLGAVASLRHLDALTSRAVYLPLDTATMRSAARLWADLWGAGQPIGSADGLGADAILAAQAIKVDATVVTTNAKHLGRMVRVLEWPA